MALRCRPGRLQRTGVFAPALLVLLPCISVAAQPLYVEIFFKVSLNGEEVAHSALLLQTDDGALALRAEDLLAWRVRLPPDSRIMHAGEYYVPLAAYPGASYEIDPTALSLSIELPPAAFEATRIRRRPVYPAPQRGIGAYLNYDLLYSDVEQHDPVASGVAEVVMFAPPKWGVLVNSALFEKLHDAPSTTRLASSWSKDLVDRRETVTVGDGFTAASALAIPVRFGGVQWATNFSVDPGFVSVPTTNIAGIAERQAVVEIFIDGALEQTSEVPAGPFEIEQISGVTGQGEIQMVITDLLGRQQVIVQPYSLGPQNLAGGVADFSVESGVLRQNYGKVSTDYGPGFASASYRRGLTDRITLGGHLEVASAFQAGGIEGAFALPRIGALGLIALCSTNTDDTGWRAGASYVYRARRYGFGIASEWTTRSFRQIGLAGDVLPPAHVDRARFNLSMGSYGNLGVSWANRELRGEDNQSVASTFYTARLGPATLILQGTRVYEPDPATTVGLTMVFPLGPSRSAQLGGTRKDNSSSGFAQYQRGLGQADTGYAYRLRTERNDDLARYDGSLALHGESGRITFDANRTGDANSYRAGLGGGVVLMDGDIFLTRPVRRGLAVVDTGDVGGITVYRNNHKVGKTGDDGRILVPQLQPYYRNQLRIDPLDAPLDATVGESEKLAVPYARAGVVVHFPVKRSHSVTLTLVDIDGAPIPAGSTVRVGTVVADTPVALDGFLYLHDLDIGQTILTIDGGKRPCQFTLDIPEDPEPLAYLGRVICR
ncbi:MAG: fimbria/pilus outer membrane usher protein [Pseudomonadota bacterium]